MESIRCMIFISFIIVLSFSSILFAGDSYTAPYETSKYLGNPVSYNTMELWDPHYGGNESMRLIDVSSTLEPKELADYWDRKPNSGTWQKLYVCDKRFEKYVKNSNYLKAIEFSQTLPKSDRICDCIEVKNESFSNRKYDIESGYKMGDKIFLLLTHIQVFPTMEMALKYKNVKKKTVFKYTKYGETHNRIYNSIIHYEFCGDGIVQNNESCDDGELNGTPGYCNETCFKKLSQPIISDNTKCSKVL